MDFTPTPLFYIIIGLLIGMIIGWGIGFFDSNGRTASKIQVAESKADAIIREAEKKIAHAEQQIALASKSIQGSQVQDNPGILRLKSDNGRFALEMDGAPVGGVLSPDKKKRLIELITIFRPWLEGGQPVQTVSQPAASGQAAPPASQDPIPFSPQPVVSLTKKAEPEKNFASLSIVQQIDTILQTRLLNTPLEKQGIRLQESSQGGVEVYVGLQKFLAVEDVPDTFIRSEIRGAIADWEEKYTPKL